MTFPRGTQVRIINGEFKGRVGVVEDVESSGGPGRLVFIGDQIIDVPVTCLETSSLSLTGREKLDAIDRKVMASPPFVDRGDALRARLKLKSEARKKQKK